MAAAAHYVIATGGAGLGRTKLNKVLWFADCQCWRKHGHTITGLSDYVKLQYGPVPPRLDLALSRLSADGRIAFDSQYVGTYVRHGFRSLREPIGNALSRDEISILDDVVTAVSSMTAFEVSELSHDALWHATPYGGKIPVRAAAVQHEPPDQRILDWARGQRTG